MLALIHSQFRKFVISKYGLSFWESVNSDIHLSTDESSQTKNLKLIGIVNKTVEKTNVSLELTLSNFGDYISKTVIFSCNEQINKNWKTMDLLEHSDLIIDYVMKKYLPFEIMQPKIGINRVSRDKLEFTYNTDTTFSHLGREIVRGLATYYGEEQSILINVNLKKNGSSTMRVKLKKNKII